MSSFLEILIGGLLLGGVYSALALAIVIVYKATGVVSIAHGQFVVCGAFVFWTCWYQHGFAIYISLLVTMVFLGILGAVAQRLTLQPLIGQSALTNVMMTIVLFAFLHGIVVMLWGSRQESLGDLMPSTPLTIGGILISRTYLWSFLIAILLMILFVVFFQYHRIGLAMRAICDDTQIALSMGIRVRNFVSLIWAISAAMAGIVGILVGIFQSVTHTLDNWGLMVLTTVLLGGLDSIPGAILGGLAMGVLQNLSTSYLDQLVGGGTRDVIPFLIMVLILLIRPTGFLGSKKVERA